MTKIMIGASSSKLDSPEVEKHAIICPLTDHSNRESQRLLLDLLLMLGKVRGKRGFSAIYLDLPIQLEY